MLSEWHNIHRGERAFILGSGPSLLTQQGLLPSLRGETTFGCSKLFNWGALPFIPTYQVMTEGEHARNAAQYKWRGVRASFMVWHDPIKEDGWVWVPKAPMGQYLIYHGTKGLGDEFEPLTMPRTSPLMAAQIALWMGITCIYLLGCDLTPVGDVYDVTRFRNVSKSDVLAEPYRRVAQDMAEHGRTLWDCTPDGYLSRHGIVPAKTLEEVLA